MKIRVVDVSESDKNSARIFFQALTEFYDISDAEALDMFARDGALTVSCYADKVACLDVWELSNAHHEALTKFSPREIRIGCSYRSIDQSNRTYGLVVIDTPQGVHKDDWGIPRVEHFEVLRRVRRLLKPRALIVLYVNRDPYDRNVTGEHGYDQYDEYNFPQWMKARAQFYGRAQGITEEQALAGYRRVLGDAGLRVETQLIVPCHSDVPGKPAYAFRLALEVVAA